MLDSLKAGQKIRFTITRDVRISGAQSTVERLMRFDPDNKRTLKSAQEYRMKTLVVKSRGRRPWECRAKSARYTVPVKGATWTMTFFPHVLPDIKSVEQYLQIEKA